MPNVLTLHEIDAHKLDPEDEALVHLREMAGLSETDRARITRDGASLVKAIRGHSDPGLMEVFLAEYGLSTEEGIALMCLAEALLRVPDAETMDDLIEDKIAPSDWNRHLGHSHSSLVNASTWALMLTGRVLDDERPGIAGALRGVVKRMGEPVIRRAVSRAMKEMGRQFVLGETISKAMNRAEGMQKKGYTYSYDMLGEAAMTEADALGYDKAYREAITAIARHSTHGSVAENPGISVKLSALHPRYEIAQRDTVMTVLAPRLLALAKQAKAAGMGLNIDAEEADRLILSLQVIEKVLADPDLAGWDGFGVVVQAYGQRAPYVIDWLHALATRLNRRIMVRLVKGAYWDAEVKLAQVEGLPNFPVFTRKAATDISYIANAKKLLGMTDRIYPQFATHNAHTVAAILQMDTDRSAYEFQRLHGMGETLHNIVMQRNDTRCRIYAPVGAHKDLLAYLVRRLLENGANSSFVNQIVDEDVPPEVVAADPFSVELPQYPVPTGPLLFAPERVNSQGYDLSHLPTLKAIDDGRAPFSSHQWAAAPLIASAHIASVAGSGPVTNPARPNDTVGHVTPADEGTIEAALSDATPWEAADRADVLRRVADLYEANAPELFALLAREAGKIPLDCVGELREAVDFLRYYAVRSARLDRPALGTVTCISPWNFPLAIFTGQIAASLAAGNAVLAKPAEQTGLIAHRAAELMHEAGVPRAALQLLPGGGKVGAALTSDPRVDGVVFTGSTATALKIRAAMAEHLTPGAPLIAETGGLNAMIVDSTALPEHAVRDIVASAFQSAGQRCSALRCLYVQEDIADSLTEMLTGAMDAMVMGDPWDISTDVGPVIDDLARSGIAEHIETARREGRLLHEISHDDLPGHRIAPTLIKVGSIGDIGREVFGPVLHLATYRADQTDAVCDAINATGFGLTFGLQTRIDDRVQRVADRIEAGNIYVNRNQIGAVVGSQPFGGERLSGTGPKAGGPNYLPRLTRPVPGQTGMAWTGTMDESTLAKALRDAADRPDIAPRELPGPTGESNRYSAEPRLPILCLGPGEAAAQAQETAVLALGGRAVRASGTVAPDVLKRLDGFDGVLFWSEDQETARAYAAALSRRKGPILPLLTAMPDLAHVLAERHVCIDTTASGGNAALLAEVSAGDVAQAAE